MTLRRYITYLLITPFFINARAQRAETDKALQLLDADIERHAAYTSSKLQEIQGYKNNLKVAVLDADAYLSCKHIAEAYSHFDSDSALFYLQRCYDYGVKQNNEVWKQDAVIHSAYILADRGDNYIAFFRLQTIGDISLIHPKLQQDYACAMMMGYVRTTTDASKGLMTQNAEEAWKKYSPYIEKNSSHYYLFFSAIYPSKRQKWQEQKLTELLKKTPKHSTDEATLRMLLSLVYKEAGQQDRAIEQLALSASADLRCANKNSTSLVMLTSELNDNKQYSNDVDRMMKYLEICSSNVSTFKDVGRSVRLVYAQNLILNEYRQQVHTLRNIFIFIFVLAVLLMIAVFYIFRRLRTQRNQQKEEANKYQKRLQQLENTIKGEKAGNNAKEEKIDQLQTYNQKFSQVLANQFFILSSYLDDMKNFKKEIANLIASGKTVEARKVANNTVVKDKSTKQFYQLFDQNFLYVHPDFPDKLNVLLRPECQLNSEKEGTLTPEQRIYALISLGIDESKQIVEILHYSVQTIYNYRMKIRHGCIDPNIKIDEVVATMYRQQS